ncbi:MAG: hypothetical protein IKN09_03475 [Clostridia bacterium]|nr:hypothetical protein [Clostridia bacterium]
MPGFIDNILSVFNKIFRNQNMLEASQSEKFLQSVLKAGVIREYTEGLEEKLNLQYLDNQYGKKLGNENNIYYFELNSKLTEQQVLDLAKKFFSSLGNDFEKKAESVIDGKSEKFSLVTEPYGQNIINGQPRGPELKNFNEIFCPMHGDLRDLYCVVHEVTHSMDLEKGETEARTIFGEIAPQCMERLLDDFLLNMGDSNMQKYGFDRNTVIQDVRYRIISTFLDRKDTTRMLNRGTYFDRIDRKEKPYSFKDKREFLRYTLAQMYATELMQMPENKRVNALLELMKNIQDNDMTLCSKSFGVDLFNKIKMQNVLNNVTESVKRNDHMIVEKETMDRILGLVKLGKDFKTQFFNQTIHVSLQSKIPFILVTPAHIQDGQTLIVNTNNNETTNQNDLFLQAMGEAKDLNNYLKGSAPILIPILPSLGQIPPYYQQLSAECFKNGERPDLDIVQCINSAKKIMKNEHGVNLNDKVFLNGYSAPGVAAQRFALLHPELIDTLCVGGASGSIPIPSSQLDYPLGTKNFRQLFGQDFNEEAYRKITFNYYVGELETLTESTDRNGKIYPMHDMSYMERSVPPKQGAKYRQMYGQDMFARADNIVKILRKDGYKISHQVLLNIAHNERESKDIMKRFPSIKGARGILSCNEGIIRNSYYNMIQSRNLQSKNIDKVL